jgi:integrase
MVAAREPVKNKRAHTVPLSKAAQDLIASMRPVGAQFVLTIDGVSPLAGWSRIKARLDSRMAELAKTTIAPWVVHDVRRTVATNLQKLAVKVEVTEAILNHSGGSRGGLVSVYQKYQYGSYSVTLSPPSILERSAGTLPTSV